MEDQTNEEARPEEAPIDEANNKETMSAGDVPRIYVASLSDYNAGRLHGAWIDAAQDDDDLQSDIDQMLADSPEPIAEEWAIRDYENFGDLRLGEYESLGLVSRIARGIVEYGPAFAAWVDVVDRDDERLDQFEEAYHGEWDSMEQFAESLIDDLGLLRDLDDIIPETLRGYVDVDFDALGRDLELSGDYDSRGTPNGSVWVFYAL